MSDTSCSWDTAWQRDDITVIDCATCGFKHQYPIPTQAEVDSLYAEEYYVDFKPEYQSIVQEDAEHFAIWADIRRGIIEDHLGPDIERSVLDVGSSFGQTLETFQNRGWRAVGVEPFPAAGEYAREQKGLTVHTGLLENLDAAEIGAPFGVVHMADVINHLRDPVATLRRIHDELLLPGGIVVVETSNDFNPLQMAIVETYDDVMWWIVPDHVSYFSDATLGGVLEQTGFDVVFRDASFPMEIFPLMGDNYRADAAVGKACHRKRVTFETTLHKLGMEPTRRDLYSALAAAGLGRNTILYARKPR